MEKIELSVETTKGTKKTVFFGRVDFVKLHHVSNLEREEWHLVLCYSKFPVYQNKFPFYPASFIQQLIRQGIDVETFRVETMDLDTYQDFTDLNTKR